MKIGFDDTPAAPAGTYSQHLARLLAEYAPEHEYTKELIRSVPRLDGRLPGTGGAEQ